MHIFSIDTIMRLYSRPKNILNRNDMFVRERSAAQFVAEMKYSFYYKIQLKTYIYIIK